MTPRRGALAALVLVPLAAAAVWWLTREGCRLSLPAHDGPVRALAVAADGATLASGGADGTVRLWRLPDGAPGATLAAAHPGGVTALAFAPAGGPLASAGEDGSVKLWVADGSGTPRVLPAGKGEVAALAFSPDGKTLYAAVGKAVRAWDAVAGQERLRLAGHGGRVQALVLSPDGATLASAGDNAIRLWRPPATTPKTLAGHLRKPAALVFTRDGKTLLSAGPDGQVRTWDVATGAPGEPLAGPASRVVALAALPDGRAVGGCEDRGVLVWRLGEATRPPLQLAQRSPVQALATTPDGRLAITGGRDGRLRVWDLPP